MTDLLRWSHFPRKNFVRRGEFYFETPLLLKKISYLLECDILCGHHRVFIEITTEKCDVEQYFIIPQRDSMLFQRFREKSFIYQNKKRLITDGHVTG